MKAYGVGHAVEAEYCEMLSKGRQEKQWKTSLEDGGFVSMSL